MIKRASIEDIHLVAPLFDLYRQFYSQPSDLKSASTFLTNLISLDESVIYYAVENDQVLGFIQLYPSYSSVRMKRLWILNDLFVPESARGKGIGEALISQAVALAKSTGACALTLETAPQNPARKLYERLGFKLNTYCFYELKL